MLSWQLNCFFMIKIVIMTRLLTIVLFKMMKL